MRFEGGKHKGLSLFSHFMELVRVHWPHSCTHKVQAQGVYACVLCTHFLCRLWNQQFKKITHILSSLQSYQKKPPNLRKMFFFYYFLNIFKVYLTCGSKTTACTQCKLNWPVTESGWGPGTNPLRSCDNTAGWRIECNVFQGNGNCMFTHKNLAGDWNAPDGLTEEG
jgi:hypothetical protein